MKKKTLFVQLPFTIDFEPKKTIHLVNVCAWCPKDSYPQLKKNEDYSHGLCKKHYKELTQKKILSQ